MPANTVSKFEFGGLWATVAITFGLPLLLFVFAVTCNDSTGCPVPSLVQSKRFSWETLQVETGWRDGIWSFPRLGVSIVVLAYYMLNMALWRMLPAQEMYGTKLVHHDRPLKYRLNAFTTSLIHLTICGIGTYSQGANFIVWTYITDHYVEILMANMVISFTASLYLYIHSFGVDCRYPNPELRELAPAGHTDNQFYDFFIGRELNPRVTLPIFGEVDLKSWFGMRPGLTGWMLVDLAFMAKQYRSYGYVSSSMIFVTSVQSYYVLEGQYNEAGFLTMRDITTDGLGFMLTFGDLVWVPFLYSTQCRYLSVYPTPLSWMQMVTTSVCFVLGLYIFRASNSQKIIFRTRPSDPRVAHLSYIQTKRGTNLLTAGWWGISRHINYLGDWLQSFPFCLATGLAGYAIIPAGHAVAPEAFQMLDGRQVVQGPARGWGVLFTYLYAVYFAVLLIHREKRDDALCSEKYGSDWQRYRKIVRWRIVPGVY